MSQTNFTHTNSKCQLSSDGWGKKLQHADRDVTITHERLDRQSNISSITYAGFFPAIVENGLA